MTAEVGGDDVVVDAIARGETAKAHLRELFDHRQRDVGRGAGAAVLLFHIRAEQSGFTEAIPERPRHHPLLFPRLIVRCNLLLERATRHVSKQREFIQINGLIHVPALNVFLKAGV